MTTNTAVDTKFDAAVATFISGAQNKINSYFASERSGDTPTVLSVAPGRRYVKVLADGAELPWAFIDRSNGDVLKAASNVQPAKVARGNLFDSSNGLDAITNGSITVLKRGRKAAHKVVALDPVTVNA
jgi:hypothetical protein